MEDHLSFLVVIIFCISDVNFLRICFSAFVFLSAFLRIQRYMILFTQLLRGNSINPISEFITQVLSLTSKHVNWMASQRQDVEIMDQELHHAVGIA